MNAAKIRTLSPGSTSGQNLDNRRSYKSQKRTKVTLKKSAKTSMKAGQMPSPSLTPTGSEVSRTQRKWINIKAQIIYSLRLFCVSAFRHFPNFNMKREDLILTKNTTSVSRPKVRVSEGHFNFSKWMNFISGVLSVVVVFFISKAKYFTLRYDNSADSNRSFTFSVVCLDNAPKKNVSLQENWN